MNSGSVLAILALASLAALGAYVAGARLARAHRAAELSRANAELSRRMRELFLLQELTYLLSESLNFERIVEQVAKYLVRFLDAEGALVVVARPGEGGLEVAAAEGSLAGLRGRTFPEPGAGLVSAAMARDKLEVAGGTTRSALLPGVEVGRAAVAPLRAHGVTAGAIVAVDAPEAFGSDHLRLLSTVAAHAAVVLSHARLFELLRLGKEEWESTFDTLEDGIAVLDDRGDLQRANRALAALLGEALPSLVGRNLAQALLGDPADLSGLYQAARRGQRPEPLTRRSETLKRIFRVSAAPMHGEASPGQLVVLVEDVTEQKAFETQMIQHEKMAAVGQLVSGVAHELNNPLTSVVGLAELLAEQAATPPAIKEHLRIIHEQAERAGKIVRNLLTFARPGTGEVETVDLSDVVRRTTGLLEYEVRLQQVHLATELAPEPALVRGDRMQIQQVVVNLVTNAIQAVLANPPERPRRVLVRTRRDRDRVVLEVEDTGPGVPEDLVPKILTPFFTTKDPGLGTGLGLAITYGILQRHGGTIDVRRAPGGGALFLAELPALAPAPRPSGAAERFSGAPHSPVPGRDVLLVDGDPAVQRMISALFSGDGHRVEAARDGVHAVELLGQRHYDLVIADPRADVGGEWFAETLRARWPRLMDRAIFATADVRPETEEWLRRLGGRYVHKPVNAKQLRREAAEVLDSD